MMKQYQLQALWPLLDFRVEALPFLASVDPYGDAEVTYLADPLGLWLSVPFAANRDLDFEAVTGFSTAELQGRNIGGREVYGLRGGAPLLPFPFTVRQLWEFDRRAHRVVYEGVERGVDEKSGDDTEGWLADLGKTNPDAVELARALLAAEEPAPSASTSTGSAVGPVQRSAAHQLEVLRKLRELEYDPKALPSPAPGKPSPARAAVRKALPHMTPVVFKKTWERLLASGDITYT